MSALRSRPRIEFHLRFRDGEWGLYRASGEACSLFSGRGGGYCPQYEAIRLSMRLIRELAEGWAMYTRLVVHRRRGATTTYNFDPPESGK